jgi:transposase
MMLKVWLYGYALGMTSSRRLEQRDTDWKADAFGPKEAGP